MDTHQITNLLQAWNNGDSQAFDKLSPLVDHELKRTARAFMRRERTGHTFQTRDLINEALIRLLAKTSTGPVDNIFMHLLPGEWSKYSSITQRPD